MGLRFHRHVRILRRLWLNESKSGASTSIGGHGATLSIGKHGTQTTLGLPGSGLSYRSKLEPWGASSGRGNLGIIIIAAIVALAIIAAVVLEAQ
jgi:hypothetical protein